MPNLMQHQARHMQRNGTQEHIGENAVDVSPASPRTPDHTSSGISINIRSEFMAEPGL